MSVKRKTPSLASKLFIAALITVAVVLLILYIAGGRYMKDDKGNKFIGFTSENADGRMLKSGTIYYADGLTAKVAAYGQTIVFADGTAVTNANRLEFSNGELYEGQMNGIKRSGRGRYTWTSGDIYEGDFVNDEYTGSGVQYWSDGSVYFGQFTDSKRNGVGVYLFADCDTSDLSVYNYEKLNSLVSKLGTDAAEPLPEGTWFAGNFKENRKSSYGIYHYANNDVYSGNFADDLKNGEGKFFFADGDFYEGSFADDVRSGKGKYMWQNGKVYEGDFADGNMNGYGKFTWPNGNCQEGYFKDGERVDAPSETSIGE